MRTVLVIRFDYGSIVPWVRAIPDGLRAIAGPDSVVLHTPVPIRGENLHSVGEFDVEAGQHVPFRFTWHPSHETCPELGDPEEEVEATQRWWQQLVVAMHLSGALEK